MKSIRTQVLLSSVLSLHNSRFRMTMTLAFLSCGQPKIGKPQALNIDGESLFVLPE